MAALGTVLLVAFVIICIFAVLIVLAQGENDNGMGVMGGQNSAIFGARSDSVLTKATYVLVTLFFLATVGLALIYKVETPAQDLQLIGTQQATQNSEDTQKQQEEINWIEQEAKNINGTNAIQKEGEDATVQEAFPPLESKESTTKETVTEPLKEEANIIDNSIDIQEEKQLEKIQEATANTAEENEPQQEALESQAQGNE